MLFIVRNVRVADAEDTGYTYPSLQSVGYREILVEQICGKPQYINVYNRRECIHAEYIQYFHGRKKFSKTYSPRVYSFYCMYLRVCMHEIKCHVEVIHTVDWLFSLSNYTYIYIYIYMYTMCIHICMYLIKNTPGVKRVAKN